MGKVHGLVGREPALAVLETALDAVARGQGRTVLVAGVPGIGKTALVAEAARRAMDRGALVLWGQCWEGDGVPAYWPWTQILRAAVGLGVPAELGEARRLVPDLAGGKAAAAVPDDEPNAARFRLFDAVVRFLVHAAENEPVVVVLDDLQWADESSLLLLEFAGRHLQASPVLILGAYRDVEADDRLLQVVGGAQVVPLEGLSAAEVAALMARVAGAEPDQWVAGEVWRRTGGNPFFVSELTRLLVAGGGVARGHQPAPGLLDSVRETLERRLARLSQPCADLLSVAAVSGPEPRLDLLARIWNDRDNLAELLTEAVVARVLIEPDAPLTPYRFVHDLFRETISTGLPPSARIRLHLAVGRALETLRDEGTAVHDAELATHFVAAASAGATAEAVRYSVLAAAEATAGLAFEEASAHYERALGALDLGDEPDPATHLDLLLGLAGARNRSGDVSAARRSYLDAAALARRLSDAAGLARAALGIHALGARSFTPRHQNLALLEEAASALDEDGTALRARVLASIARELRYSSDRHQVTRAPAVAEESVAAARLVDDADTLAFCLLALHDARWRPASAADRLPVIEEMLTLATGAGDRDLLVQARLLRATALIELGDPSGRAELGEYCELAEDLGHARGRWDALSRRATLALLVGRLEDAEDLSVQAERLGAEIGEPDSRAVYSSLQAALVNFDRGPGAPLDAMDAIPYRTVVPAISAVRLARDGDLDAARDTLAGFNVDDLPVYTYGLEVVAIVAPALVQAGTDGQRARAYDLLRPHAGSHVIVGGCAAYHGAVDHHLGLLAAALGRHENAAEHFEIAVTLHERLGATGWAQLSREHLKAARGPASAAGTVGVFRREGDVWTLGYDGTTVHLPDVKGLHDIATLLGCPGQPVHAVQLYTGHRPTSGADPVLDERAKASYRARLAELDAGIDEADAHHDPYRSERTRIERDVLIAELSAAVGLSGRPRRLGAEGERARKAVTRRITNALGRIERQHAALGHHLRDSISTGTSCAYEPSTPTRWAL